MLRTTKLTWSPLRGATANAPLFLLTRRLGSTTGGQPLLGETNGLLPRDLNQQKGKAPAQSWPKGGGHKGDPFPGKGHKGDQYKGKGGQYGYQQGQFGRGGSARSRTPTGGYQPDARGSGYKGV